ncbi:O-acetylserine/cysteine efflux transporter [Hydrogenophaga laconesensis]|uniref:O-acetylserine/cysteine efflux transporter n=1 Tax=Hydrogenophaga laconesensis TaxID=1805971 RepID=A0ABU1VEM2_9BURK|nr:EamA family transporter [Hydrogenophaga laconesensis]MDR7095902.1 O-acetylserine/cysteine efflux transporter [Hydrogenophaga laconesensis]
MSTVPLSRGDLLRALAVVVIWGLNFVVMKVGLQGVGPMLLGALRFAAAALPFLLFVRFPNLPLRYVVAYGLAQGLGQFGFLFLGLQMGMTAGMASVVMQTQAFFTLLLAVPVLGERARFSQGLGLAVALGGLVLIATAHGEGPGQMTLAGFVLTLGAAFMWAISNLVARLASRLGDYDPFPFIVWSSLFPVLPFVALALWMDGPQAVVAQLAGMRWPAALAVLFLAWLATLLAYSLWTQLLKRHPAGRVTPFSLLVPVVGLWAAWMFFDELPLLQQWLGTGLVLLGLVVNQLGGLFRGRKG